MEFARITPITEGNSPDKKYYAETADGGRYFLRVCDAIFCKRIKYQFDVMEQLNAHLGEVCPRPVALEMIPPENKECFSLETWHDGEPLYKVILSLDEQKQYELGLQAGKILKQIHKNNVTENCPIPIETLYAEYKADYEKLCDPLSEVDKLFDAFKWGHLFENETVCLLHHDFSMGNMIFDGEKLIVVDFHAAIVSARMRDFAMLLTAYKGVHSGAFSSAFIHGYWNGKTPGDFWQKAVFIASCVLIEHYIATHVPPFSAWMRDVVPKLKQFLAWHNDLEKPVPPWYLHK